MWHGKRNASRSPTSALWGCTINEACLFRFEVDYWAHLARQQDVLPRVVGAGGAVPSGWESNVSLDRPICQSVMLNAHCLKTFCSHFQWSAHEDALLCPTPRTGLAISHDLRAQRTEHGRLLTRLPRQNGVHTTSGKTTPHSVP